MPPWGLEFGYNEGSRGVHHKGIGITVGGSRRRSMVEFGGV